MKILKNSAIYLGASVISKGTPFLLLPFLTQHLSPKEFGLLSIFLVLNSLCIALIGMSMQINITKNFFRTSKGELSLITGNVLILLMMTSGIYFVVALVLPIFLETFFSIPSSFLFVLPILAFISMVKEIHLTILRNEGRAYVFGAIEILNAFLILVFTVILLHYTSLGWLSQVVGMLSAGLFVAILGLFHFWSGNYVALRYRKRLVASILKLSVPLIPHVLGGVVITVSDRLFIETYVGLEQVALYSIGYSVGRVVSLFTDAFIKAWNPWFYQQIVHSDDKRKLQIVRFTYLYIFGVLLFAIVVSIAGNFLIPLIVQPEYVDANQYIVWICIGFAIQGVYKIFFPYLVHLDKTIFLAFSTMLAALVNLVLNYFFVQEFGAIGAAYATIIAFFVSALLVFDYQRRNLHMPWRMVRRNDES